MTANAKSAVGFPAYIYQLLWLVAISSSAYAQPAATTSAQVPGNTIVRAAGTSEMYLYLDGRKHHVPSAGWVARKGYRAPALVLPPDQLAAIPESYSLTEQSPVPGSARGSGILLVGPDGKIYLVEQGEKHWITDERWITASRFAHQTPMPALPGELDSYDLGSNLGYISSKRRVFIGCVTACLFALLFVATSERGQHLLSARQARFQRPLWVVFFGFLILFREPYLLLHPRFWAEEGVFWFVYGAQHPIFKTLLYLLPISNYFNLTANIGAVLSSRTAYYFGLEYAPSATTLLAFFIEMSAISLILSMKSRLFDSLPKAITGCLIVLLASTTSDEILLNTINSMSFLGLITLLLLFAEIQDWRLWQKWGARGLLLLAGLSSPYALVLFPAYLVSARHGKSRERRAQCAILAACMLLQAGVVINTERQMAKSGIIGFRGTNFRLDAAAVHMFVGHMLYPAMGTAGRDTFLEATGLGEAWASADSPPPRPLTRFLRVGGSLCTTFVLIILWTARGPTLFSTPNLLILAFVLLSGFTCVTSLYAIPAGRYAFMPGATFLLLLLADAEVPKPLWRRLTCLALLSFALVVGGAAYRTPQFQMGPSWQEEVAKWRADPSYQIQAWPTNFHTIAGVPDALRRRK